MTASDVSKEAIYLKRLLMDIEKVEDIPVKLNISNQGALKLGENPIYHKRSKHIDIITLEN